MLSVFDDDDDTYIFNVYITNLLIHSMSRCQRKNIYTTSLQCYHIFKNRRHDIMYKTEDKCKMQTLCKCMFMWEESVHSDKCTCALDA